ncbi:hypothetical protein [Rhizorhabdus histidinilytica]
MPSTAENCFVVLKRPMTISYEKPDHAGVSYQDEGRVPHDII